jgi:hypothetical protein
MTERVTIYGESSHPTRVVEDPDRIDNPVLAFFLVYWREKCGTAPVPPTGAFNPKDVRAHLPWLVLADAIPGQDDFRYRLVGTRVAEYFLGDGTGKTVREAFTDERMREPTLWLYRQVCSEQKPIRLTAPGGKVRGVYFPDYDAVHFPYASDGKTADRILTVFTFNYQKFLETRSVRALTQ